MASHEMNGFSWLKILLKVPVGISEEPAVRYTRGKGISATTKAAGAGSHKSAGLRISGLFMGLSWRGTIVLKKKEKVGRSVAFLGLGLARPLLQTCAEFGGNALEPIKKNMGVG
ncbi:hypothetical protein QQP08_023762 [Theobroma cacao]|nr:hypothetical protein QQP08_023762 [Theobroma cacao]